MTCHPELNGRIVAWLRQRPPGVRHGNGECWTLAEDALLLGDWMSNTWGLPSVSMAALEEGIKTVANKNRFHPVREWIKAQEWDGKPRVDAQGNPISPTADAVMAFKRMAGITQSYSVMGKDGKAAPDVNEYVDARTRETMNRIRAALPEPLPDVTVDPRLLEVSFGIYEGHLHTELTTGAMAMAGERDAAFWYFRPPEGESYEDVSLRILDFGRSLSGPAIIVSHGGILRVLRHLIEGFPHERAVNWFPPQDSVVHFLDGRSQVYPAGQSWDD